MNTYAIVYGTQTLGYVSAHNRAHAWTIVKHNRKYNSYDLNTLLLQQCEERDTRGAN